MTSPSADEAFDHYEVLGVEPTATADEIEAAWKHQMKEHHPDRGGDHRLAQAINRAHDVLSDPEQRERYDALRAGDLADGAEPTTGGFDAESFEEEAWGDWDDFASTPRAATTTFVAPEEPPPPSQTTVSPWLAPLTIQWWRRPLGRTSRRVSLVANVVMILMSAIGVWLLVDQVRRQTSDFTLISESRDAVPILAALVVPSALLLVGLGTHAAGVIVRSLRARTSPFTLPPVMTGATAIVAMGAVLILGVTLAAAPGLFSGGGFGAVAAQVDQALEDEREGQQPSQEPSTIAGVTGDALSAGSCELGANDRGWLIPDPSCTPGVIAPVTQEQLCEGALRVEYPGEAEVAVAQAEVARAYSGGETTVDPADVVTLIPIRLGGLWDRANMWPRGPKVKAETVDAVLRNLCAPDSTLTLADVQAAARSNELVTLVN